MTIEITVSWAIAQAAADTLRLVIAELRASPTHCLISQHHNHTQAQDLERFVAALQPGRRIVIGDEPQATEPARQAALL